MWFLQLFGGITLSLADKTATRGGSSPAQDGTVHRFRTQKYGLLLAYIALHPDRTHRRDDLVSLFWGDSENETAGRVCLRTALSSLRRLLTADNPLAPTDPFLAPDRETLRLHPHLLQTDAVLFEKLLRRAQAPNRTPAERRAFLERAQSLYKGPLLPGSDEPWVIGERERFAAMHERLVESLAKLPVQRTPGNGGPNPPVSVPRGNQEEIALPASPNRFFGRIDERETVRRWLCDEDARLVTLTGIGGIGKTRLAMETAREIIPTKRFARIAWVPLVSCADPSLLPETVLAALLRTPGYEKMEQGESAMETLLPLLREPNVKTLLVLDNLEHLLVSANNNGTLRFVQTLLASVPNLYLLATSRSRLAIAEERELPLGGLTTDAASSLMIERARSAGRPDWGSSGETSRDAVQTICRTLETIPLAMELVAGWAAVLSPRQMRERLTERIGLLLDSPLTTRRHREGESARHHSLRAALDWGTEDLSRETRAFFRGLAYYFRGGCTLAAAAAVLTRGSEDDALRLLMHLRERSLLQTSIDVDDTVRYHLLEPVREWIVDQEGLAATDTDDDAQERHFYFFVKLMTEECLRAGGEEAALGFARLEADEENLLMAMEYGLLNSDNKALGVALERLARLHWCWWVRGRQSGQRQVQRMLLAAYTRRGAALEREDPEQYAALVLTVAPSLPPEESAPVLETLLGFYESAGKLVDAACVCEQQASLASQRGDHAAIDIWMERAVGLREAAGDTIGVGYALANWAGIRSARGQYAEAHELLIRCRTMALARGDAGRGDAAKIAIGLAHIALNKRELPEAEALAREAVSTFADRNETWNHADALMILGKILLILGDRVEEAHAALRESQRRFIATGNDHIARDIEPLLKTS